MRDIKYARTITCRDTTYNDLRIALETHIEGLRRYAEELPRLELLRDEAKTDKDVVDMVTRAALSMLQAHLPEGSTEVDLAAAHLNSLRTQFYNRYYAFHQDCERTIDRSREYENLVARTREQVSSYPEDYTPIFTLTKEEVAAKFKHVSSIEPASIALGSYEGQPCLRFVVSDIFLRPDVNNCSDYVQVENIEIALDPIEVLVLLEAKRIHFYPLHASGALYNFNGPSPHPHVLSNHGDACLGDYGGAITEAIDSHDWETLASLVFMFLSNCASHDAAGRLWYKGLRKYDAGGNHKKLLPSGLSRSDGVIITEDPEHRGFFFSRPKTAAD